MPFPHYPRPYTLASLADAAPLPFWLDDPKRPEPVTSLTYPTTADLLVIGAGFTGLWTALLARETNPSFDVVILEEKETAAGASGLNGGFIAASLTHGFWNGLARWPDELARITTLGHANLDAIQDTVDCLNIDCDFMRSGELSVATEPYQIDDLRNEVEHSAPYGEAFQWLEQDQVRTMVDSPTYLGAIFNPSVAMVNPARLAWGLRRACLQSDVRLFERTPVTQLEFDGKAVTARTPYGSVRAVHVALATSSPSIWYRWVKGFQLDTSVFGLELPIYRSLDRVPLAN